MSNIVNYSGYRLLDIEELHMMLLQTMKDIHQVCVKNKICYYLHAGSMLGAVRHKGFIPWDDDMDIVMPRNDFEHFKEIFNHSFEQEKYFLQHYGTDVDFRPASMHLCINNTIYDNPSERHLRNHKGIHIDIFPLDNVPDGIKLRNKQARKIRRNSELISSKLYRNYKSNFVLVSLLRRFKHCILFFIPLSLLQKRRVKLMTKYDLINTKCVASMQSQYSYEKQTMRREIYGIPQMYEFEGVMFYGPEKYDDYLCHLYGKDYMELPPVEKRVVPLKSYIKNEE